MASEAELTGPDLGAGVEDGVLEEEKPFEGHVGEESVILVKRSGEVFAVGAQCTHYGGPLSKGLVVGETVRCPWHHACFSLRTGEAECAPALSPIDRWKVEREGEKWFVREKIELEPAVAERDPEGAVVIIGAGAAGNAAAEMLRREGYAGRLTMIGAEEELPYDRPNLSKDYLAGNAPEEWIPLRTREFYEERGIELALGARVAALDLSRNVVVMEDGREHPYTRLLIATGADPVRLDVPGGDLPHVHYLRTLADSRALIAAAERSRRAVVLGASFIGLEVAASLRARGLDVEVVAPEALPLERVLGARVGAFIRDLHEDRGVSFHLGTTARVIRADEVELANGDVLSADLVVIGVGVHPAVELAERAGLAVDNGVVVDEHLETSEPGVFAAGDIARWPNPRTGERLRVEHWVVAERQGQTAARNILGYGEAFDAAPFFWSRHYDVSIRYVGNARRWSGEVVDGDIASGRWAVGYREADEIRAAASAGLDILSLRAESALESGDREGVNSLFAPGGAKN